MKTSRKKERSEYAYVLSAYKRLRKQGIPTLREAPLMGRSIDLLYLSGSHLISVEFKLKDWRQGLCQARDHQIGSDYAYLCLTYIPTEAVRKAARDAGIGVFLFDEDNSCPFKKIQPAPRSKLTWPIMRNRLCEMLMDHHR